MQATRLQRLLVIGVAIAIAGCAAGPTTPASTGPLPPLSEEDATRTYGYGPIPVAGVTLQPDVIFVGGGAGSIRSASSDGLVWTIDRNAPGAAGLEVGKVMVLTSRATGRVVDIRDEGDDRVVQLSPVDLTELVSDGVFSFDQPIDLDAMSYQLIPDMPAQLIVPESSEASPSPAALGSGAAIADAGGTWDVRLPTLRLGGRTADMAITTAELPPALQPRQCAEVAVGPWSTKPCAENGNVSLAIDYKAGTLGGPWKPGLKVGVIVKLRTSNLRLRTSATVADGQVNGQTALLEGLQGVDIEVAGAAADGSADNDKVKVEVPIEIDIAIPPSPSTFGLPFNIKIEWKYILQTAFSTKNSTLTAAGSYGLDGPLGIDGGSFVTPTFSLEQSMLDSISGVTLAVSGFLLTAKMKIQVGLGVPAATAGPYVALTVSAGISLGSPLALIECRALTIDLKGGVGFGISLTQDGLKEFLDKLPKVLSSVKIKTETEKIWPIFNRSQAKPEACG